MPLDTAKAISVLRSLTAKFDARAAAATPFYPELCTIVPSQGADEEYGMLGSFPGVREFLGERLFNELRAARFTIENKLWESSLLIKKTHIADDRMGMYPPLLEALADEATHHPDELFFSLLINGESTACFDGQFFIDTDHAWGSSGTQSNDLTYNANDHNAVTVAEFKAAYHQARRTMLKFKNDNGKLLNRPVIGRLTNLLVLVPPELEVVAQEAVQSTVINNATNIILDRPRVVASAALTSAVKFWLFNLSGPVKPFIFQAREPLSRQTKGLDDIEFKDVKFMTQARYNLGYGAWWTAVQTEFN